MEALTKADEGAHVQEEEKRMEEEDMDD